MKYINHIALFLLVCIGLASCNTEDKGVLYTPKVEGVSFETNNISETVNTPSGFSVSIRVIRSETSNAYTAKYTATLSNSTALQDVNNGTISFAKGQGVDTITLRGSNLTMGSTYTATYALDNNAVAQTDTTTKTGHTTATVSVMCDYNWVNMGSVTFTDNDFTGNTVSGVPIDKAQGFNIYRLEDVYHYVDPANISAGHNLEFVLDNNYNAVSLYPTDTFINLGTGYALYYGINHYASYSSFTNSGNKYSASYILRDSGGGLHAGGSFSFVWDSGYPVR